MTLYDADFTPDISQRFLKLELPFRYRGCIVDGWLGDAPAELCSARGMLEVMKLIYERSSDDPLATEVAIDPKCYVK